MKSFGDDKIARLLRLKRYEQPPPSYFENFLHEFRRRRQRDELLREPLWSMCVDRVRDFLPAQCPSLGLVPGRNGGTGRVRRNYFNHGLSATGHHYSVSSPAFARSNHGTDYRKRI